MLHSISIRDIVLIDRLDLTFQPGLCVLTGETGAGKSIVLDALGLALGARGDAGLVRPGAPQATVSVVFDVPSDHPVRALLYEHGLVADDFLVLRRVLLKEGRSRGFVNDQPTSVAVLRQLGENLVEIQGHFEQQGLLDKANHRHLLDGFGRLEEHGSRTAAAYHSWRRLMQALADAESDIERARADAELLRGRLAELEALSPEPDEEERLAERRATLMNREKLLEALNSADAELAGERHVEDAINAARRRLERHADLAPAAFGPILQALERAALELGEATRLLTALGQEVDAEPDELERIEERFFALRALARKHRIRVDELPTLRDEVAGKLAAIDEDGVGIKELRARAAEARATYLSAATELSERRATSAAELDASVGAELAPLRLEKAQFATRIETLDEADWGEHGLDSVVFEVSTNPGSPMGPLTRIASAGELSRFMLALKVVAARGSHLPTLVFDEVDSGIGGATAAAVGDRLARLGRSVQILVVTHSPQVAARGAQHWLVQKTSSGRGVVTMVDELGNGARREEIARMLSGAEITDEARAAAESLMTGGTA